MLVEKAISDAVGARYEFKSHAKIVMDRYYGRGKDRTIGYYTDDTQMEIGLAELLLSDKDPAHWTYFDIADAFFNTYKRDPRLGYARGFQSVLDSVADGGGLLYTLWPHSRRNGAAMRCSCLGLLPDTQQVIDLAMFQAAITHATQDGLIAAAAAALMIHAFRYNEATRSNLHKYLDRKVPLPAHKGGWGFEWKNPVPISAVETVQAALTALRANNTMVGVLRDCVAFTGDTDTVAAIAIPAASVCLEIAADLPQVLYDKLENGMYGLNYLRELDEKLIQTFGDDTPKTDHIHHDPEGCDAQCPHVIYKRTGIWTGPDPTDRLPSDNTLRHEDKILSPQDKLAVFKLKDRAEDSNNEEVDWGDLLGD